MRSDFYTCIGWSHVAIRRQNVILPSWENKGFSQAWWNPHSTWALAWTDVCLCKEVGRVQGSYYTFPLGWIYQLLLYAAAHSKSMSLYFTIKEISMFIFFSFLLLSFQWSQSHCDALATNHNIKREGKIDA